MSKKLKMYLGVLVIIGAMAYLMVASFGGSSGFQVTVSDLIADGEAYAEDYLLVEGRVLPETVVWDSKQIQVEFTVTDGENQMAVFFKDVMPDNLDHKDGAEAILRGKYDPTAKLFYADTVETKCPSKYEAVEE